MGPNFPSLPRRSPVRPDVDGGGGLQPPRLPIPEIRDYQRINGELVALLDAGHPRVILDGAEGQRLLASGLRGPWDATIEIDGRTGPELAANLEAPGLTIVARGGTADGAGRGLRSGCVVVLGDAADGAGYSQSGGTLIVVGSAGHRAGLAQSGGTIAIIGEVGRLTGDRQAGGRLFSAGLLPDQFDGRGRTGGHRIRVEDDGAVPEADRAEWLRLLDLASAWADIPRFRGR